MKVAVLIVDDDAGFRRIARTLLEARGLSVAGEAADAAQARLAVTQSRPDALLLDVNLPDGSGPALARELAAVRPGLRILLTSTDDTVEPVEGIAEFVPKAELVSADLAAYFARS